MKTVIFGGSGLIGDGFLQECLHADDVTQVLAVGRTPLELTHPKLRQVVHTDFLDFSSVEDDLADADACFWGLGVSSTGMEPEAYERITYGYTTAAARALHEVNPDLTFVYVSGGGTDSTGSGRLRWARVKGRTENAIVSTFPNGYALRPGFVLPAHKARSKTTAYRWAGAAATPLVPLLRLLRLGPALVTDTAQLGRAALNLTRGGHVRHVLENREINSVAAL
ncbi:MULTISPECIES: epimerase [Streptomyces]|uniref:Epimerase n=1 Tax=Streptomyces glycanivorans TaxID=3033808 RepID=A0ABY9JK07_9ACTN|nr:MULTISPECIES: epimerase [unclassified Streptomyces]WLQ67943.1 epimerase [Streptomyces sp. Alt3]WSQ81288.1 epimerase [Streptomyces sp. NBC_01213]WSQ88618.1 epimerase [Streptomyces sp. NBC_01212]